MLAFDWKSRFPQKICGFRLRMEVFCLRIAEILLRKKQYQVVLDVAKFLL